jgi:ABC-2 type transport system ATP-binding protein
MRLIIESHGLGKRYGRTRALEDCSLQIPAGHVVALVGPNGAGKSTLLNLVVGLAAPTAGEITVLGGTAPGSAAALEDIAFVAQDAPLHRALLVRDCLHLARNLNRKWDQQRAVARLAELGMPLKHRVGKLSGGQKAQLALTIALAKHPRLLVLDEPVASLDPVARHDFMGTLMELVTEDDLSILLSSHVVSELQRVADYLVVLNRGRLQLAGVIDDVLAEHLLLLGPAADAEACASRFVPVHTSVTGMQASMLVKVPPGTGTVPPGWETSPVGLEELILAYLREPEVVPTPRAQPSDLSITSLRSL